MAIVIWLLFYLATTENYIASSTATASMDITPFHLTLIFFISGLWWLHNNQGHIITCKLVDLLLNCRVM